MIRLYRRDRLGRLEYHEAWVVGDAVVEHWGAVGTRGERRTNPRCDDPAASLERVLSDARGGGFEQLEESALLRLSVELPVHGHGCAADVARRCALEEQLGQLLGWNGLGHTVAEGARDGAMVVECLVVDLDLAERCIRRALLGTEFDDYHCVA